MAGAQHGIAIVAGNLGDWTTALQRNEEALALARQAGDRTREAHILGTMGVDMKLQGFLEQAITLYEQALSIYQELGDRSGIASVMNNLGNIYQIQQDFPKMVRMHEETLTQYRALDHQPGIAHSLHNLGVDSGLMGDFPRCIQLLEESLAIRREIGEAREVALSLLNLGLSYRQIGDLQEAKARTQEARKIFRQLKDAFGEMYVLYNLSAIAFEQQEYDRAWELARQTLTQQIALQTKLYVGETLELLSRIAYARNPIEAQARYAARLLGAAHSCSEALGTHQESRSDAAMETGDTVLREKMGEEAFAQAWERGRAMTWEEAITYALEVT
jgi:tetratricopeptide (TPR) repeat protein